MMFRSYPSQIITWVIVLEIVVARSYNDWDW